MFSFCFPGIEGQAQRRIIWSDCILAKCLRQQFLRAERALGYLLTQEAEGQILGSFREME